MKQWVAFACFFLLLTVAWATPLVYRPYKLPPVSFNFEPNKLYSKRSKISNNNKLNNLKMSTCPSELCYVVDYLIAVGSGRTGKFGFGRSVQTHKLEDKVAVDDGSR